MSAKIYQLRDFQNPKDLERMQRELEKEAVGFFAGLTDEQKAAALAYDGPENHGDPAFLRVPFGGAGIDGMTFTDSDPA